MKYNATYFFAAFCVGLILAGGCELADPELSQLPADQELNGLENEMEVNGDHGTGWRDGRSVEALPASGNVVEWETLNIGAPTSPNRPGDAEWIIARIEGQGFSRLLIMTMYTSGGARDPSRIYLEGPGGGMWDGRFNVPLPGIARWRVEASGGALRIFLNGSEIWSAAGNFTVDRAIMGDSPPRGFIGEWRPVQD